MTHSSHNHDLKNKTKRDGSCMQICCGIFEIYVICSLSLYFSFSASASLTAIFYYVYMYIMFEFIAKQNKYGRKHKTH